MNSNLKNRNDRVLPMNFRATELNSRSDLTQANIQEVHEMSRDVLIQIIIKGKIPFLEEDNLMGQELEVLRRLTFMAINYSNDIA